MGKKLTPKEVDYIRDNPRKTAEEIGREIGRSGVVVNKYRRKLGLKREDITVSIERLRELYISFDRCNKPDRYDTRSGITIINRAGERIGKWCPTLRYYELTAPTGEEV